MEEYSDVMIDLETMDTGPNAAITAIGAVGFCIQRPHVAPDPEDMFYRKVSLESAVKSGGTLSVSTILWWMGQEDAARAELQESPEHISLSVALVEFSNWIAKHTTGSKSVRVWGNGAAFDNVILSNSYARTPIEAPWKFYHDRCYRTLKSLSSVPMGEFVGVQHHAGWDAYNQTAHLLNIITEG